MTRTLRLLCLLALPMAAQAATHNAAPANDFPTVDRVLYVQECMAAHPGNSSFEMINKCSCAVMHSCT